jgi:hypothetical protein
VRAVLGGDVALWCDDGMARLAQPSRPDDAGLAVARVDTRIQLHLPVLGCPHHSGALEISTTSPLAALRPDLLLTLPLSVFLLK